MATEVDLDALELEIMEMMDEDDEYSDLSTAEGGEFLVAYTVDEPPIIGKETPLEGEVIEPDYTFSYEQMTHTHGGGRLGTVAGGRFEMIERILEAQVTEKSELWLRKLSVDLQEYFGFKKAAPYVKSMRPVPRFWVMNSVAVAGTIYMIDQLGKKDLSVARLITASERTGVPKEDLFRYYRLLKKYIA